MSIITKKKEIFDIDYQLESLTSVFIDSRHDLKPIRCDWLSPLSLENLISFINQARSTLLFAIDKLDNQQIISTLQKKADEGLRIFLCLGAKENNTNAIDHLHSRCLLRTGARQQGGLIIRDHNTLQKSAYLLSDALNNDQSYQILLNKQQVDDSYRSFCKLFWEICTDEFCGKNNNAEKAQSINYQIEVNHNYQIKEGLTSYFEDKDTAIFQDIVSIDNAIFKQLSPKVSNASRVIVSDKQSEFIKLAISQDEKISLSEEYLPNLVRMDDISWFLPQSFNKKYSNWALQLSSQQADDIDQWLSNHLSEAKWQFCRNATISELKDKTIKFAEDIHSSFDCEEQRELSIPDVYTESFDEFYNLSIEDLTKENINWKKEQLATKITYTTERHPPYCPKGAKNDALHIEWDKTQTTWVKIIVNQQANLNNLEQRQREADAKETLHKYIGQFVLGQKQKNKEFMQQLETMKAWVIKSATPAERIEKRESIEKIIHNINKNKQRTEKEIHDSEAQYQWETKRDKLKQDIEQVKKKYDEIADSIQKNTKSDNKEQLIQSTHEEISKLVEKLAESERKKFPSELSTETLTKFFKNKRNKKLFNSIFKAYEKSRKEIVTLESKQKESEKTQNDIERRLKVAQQQLEDHGSTFSPTNTSKDHLAEQLGIKNDNGFIFKLPEEELPKNNLQLMKKGNDRYLVVINTEQLTEATIDAKCLNAKLCTRKAE